MRLATRGTHAICALILLTWLPAAAPKKKTLQCPLGFLLAITDKDTPICYRQKDPETFNDKFKDCTGNLYSSKLYNSLDFPKPRQAVWTEYKSVYPGGPFVDWSYTDSKGSLLQSSLDVNYDSFGLDEELCIVIDPVSNFTAVKCDEKHYRYCFVHPYPDNDDMTSRGCTRGSLRFYSPVSTCLSPVTGVGGGTVRATWRQAREICAKRGASLLYKGWRYSNSPILHTSGSLPTYPMGFVSSNDSVLRYDTENDSSEVRFFSTK